MAKKKTSFALKKPQISMAQRICVVLWILLIMASLGVFIGALFSSNQNNQYGQNNCLLYANTAQINNGFNNGFNNPQLGGFNNNGFGYSIISNSSACSTVVFEGVAALIFAILVSIASAYYIFSASSPTTSTAWGLAVLGLGLTIYMVGVTAYASAGLVYTCAPLGSACQPLYTFSYFSTNGLGQVQTAIAFGWVASVLFLMFAILSAYWVGISYRNSLAVHLEKGKFVVDGDSD